MDSIVKDKEVLILCFLCDGGLIQSNLPQQVSAGIPGQLFVCGPQFKYNRKAPLSKGLEQERPACRILLHTSPQCPKIIEI